MNITKALRDKCAAVCGTVLADMAQDTINAATDYAGSTAAMLVDRESWSARMLLIARTGETAENVHGFLLWCRGRFSSDDGEYRNFNNGAKDYRKGVAHHTGKRKVEKVFARTYDGETKTYSYSVAMTASQEAKALQAAKEAKNWSNFRPKAAKKTAPAVVDPIALDDMKLSEEAEADWDAIVATVKNAVENDRLPEVDATEATDAIRQCFIRSHKATL